MLSLICADQYSDVFELLGLTLPSESFEIQCFENKQKHSLSIITARVLMHQTH